MAYDYDSWRTDVDASVSEREQRAEAESYEREAQREWLPPYRLHVWYDPFLQITTARLYIQRYDFGWRTLDEATASGDDPAAAVRCMRMHRRLSRGVL